jgi:hypothetical protein
MEISSNARSNAFISSTGHCAGPVCCNGWFGLPSTLQSPLTALIGNRLPHSVEPGGIIGCQAREETPIYAVRRVAQTPFWASGLRGNKRDSDLGDFTRLPVAFSLRMRSRADWYTPCDWLRQTPKAASGPPFNYFTRTSFISRPETFQSCTYRFPLASQ